MINKQLLSFEDYLIRNKSLSENTLQSYLRDIKTFLEYIKSNLSQSCEKLQTDDILIYISHLEDTGHSNSTITRHISSIRCYYQYMILNGDVQVNPAKGIKRQTQEKKQPSFLTEKEIKSLLAQPNINNPKGFRDKAMLELLYATGIKVSELINLDINDINIKAGLLICRGSKSVRVIPIYKEAMNLLSIYINKARKTFIADTKGQALFLNINGSRLTRQGFWKILKKYAVSAKIKKDITPISLRHSFALHLLQNGADLNDIKDMLGHADIASTQIYADVLSQRIKNVYNQYHPMAR